jgi:hypothetical protein
VPKSPKTESSLKKFGMIEMQLRLNDKTPETRRHLFPEEIASLCGYEENR